MIPRAGGLLAMVILSATVACNDLLGNEPGDLADPLDATTDALATISISADADSRTTAMPDAPDRDAPGRPANEAGTPASPPEPTCPAGYANCNGIASDGCETWIARDVEHCGSCENACKNNETCADGSCEKKAHGRRD